ncbi:MAG: tRNA (adenosine(37)-N6)-dimethylallyltransferase MiaA [Fimbriimonadaceae bacterium]|nr:tRNA (adenosine(37)-N6)-dimethylallyltransferase MiaA [Fimbriimonadaceae bacterium]
MKPLLIAVMGPTGSGKSDLAEALADRIGACLINSDAFQVYRGLDIGTGKSPRKAEYALVDMLDPREQYGVGAFLKDAVEACAAAFAVCRPAIVVGGTGLYTRALTEGYEELAAPPDPALRMALAARPIEDLVAELREKDPDLADRTDVRNPVRVRRALERIASPSVKVTAKLPDCRVVKLGLVVDPVELGKKIESRTRTMMHNGWVAEVERLRDAGVRVGDPGMRAIGYQTIWDVIEGRTTREEAVQRIAQQTTAYAKRQRTWLRSEPRLNLIERSSTPERVEDAMQWIDLN